MTGYTNPPERDPLFADTGDDQGATGSYGEGLDDSLESTSASTYTSGTSDSTTSTSSSSSSDSSSGGAQAKAQQVAEQGKRVADVAKEEVGTVASAAGQQVRSLADQARSEVSGQLGSQQLRLAETVRTLGGDLESMAGAQEEPGMAADLARQAAGRVQDLAGWLENSEPGDVLEEVKRFARRKPGAFLAIAAGVGLLAGLLLARK